MYALCSETSNFCELFSSFEIEYWVEFQCLSCLVNCPYQCKPCFSECSTSIQWGIEADHFIKWGPSNPFIINFLRRIWRSIAMYKKTSSFWKLLASSWNMALRVSSKINVCLSSEHHVEFVMVPPHHYL